MTDQGAKRLAALGAERLASTLLQLAERNEDAARLVARLTADPDEQGRRFKAELAALRRRKRLVTYREAGAYAAHLRDLLEDLEASVRDPGTGLELVAGFYRSDAALLEACDDSDGLVGDVFRVSARDLFVRYAERCDDKVWLGQRVFALLEEDDYGVRDAILDRAAEYLPETALRELAGRLWTAAEAAGAPSPGRNLGGPRTHRLLLLEIVARQLNDPRLFEQARRAHSPELGVAACTDIGEAWLAAGEPATALAWLERIPPDEPFMAHDRDNLLREIHDRLGNREEVERLLWKQFQHARCPETLQALLNVIGPERKDEVVAHSAAAILEAQEFSAGDAAFLMECGLTDDAARYVLERQAQLDGDQWPGLVPLAEALKSSGRHLAATTVYRALLDSILARGKSHTYRHGARYLHRLGDLAQLVEEFKDVSPHADYLAGLRARHGRKSSFWAEFSRAR